MINAADAIIFANDRPGSDSDAVYQWALDAEVLIRRLAARVQELEEKEAGLVPFAVFRTVKDERGNITHDDWQFKYADLLRIPPQGVELCLRPGTVLLPPQPILRSAEEPSQ